ncbi:hypothetical protein KXD40_008959 [Peronospora effusa]|uniref:Uncharacterized protein n=1 Tax=Peronospora effusa TaxID=542832 RepID=A0A3M6V6J5_9STRA|nr:hypothetical protein DD238_008529 [Peronospora effusa]RQM18890.1 hypothetical protein DD237_007603 [Peronospora effusa]UIZ21892.1 hypothetical protein KXD40_008959 [Peronospora effusa]
MPLWLITSIFRIVTGRPDALIIPISALFKYNVDVVCTRTCCRYIFNPKQDSFPRKPKPIVIRSFDMKKAGEDVENVKVTLKELDSR